MTEINKHTLHIATLHIIVLIQSIKQTFTKQRPFDVALLDTFATATLKELDYVNEAQNQIACKQDLEPRMKNKIYIPEVYEKLTTRKVRPGRLS